MKLDIFTHVLPRAYADFLDRRAGGLPPSLRGIMQIRSALYDLDLRRRVMDQFPGYTQVLTLTVPPIESFGKPALTRDLARCANDAMAEIVAADPDHYLGWVASPSLDDVEGGIAEVERCVRTMGAMGAHICTNVNGRPLDGPRFEPFFATMAALDRPLWVHPYRTAQIPDYPAEDSSRQGMWMAFGWPYETAVFASRVILAGYLDRYPNLRIITHHGGGMLPQFAHRIGAGLHALPPVAGPGEDPPTSHEALQARVIARYQRLYADTAVAATRLAIEGTIAFFGVQHVLFGTDMPFDPENGPGWIRDTIAVLDTLALSDADREAIYAGNARRLLGLPSATPPEEGAVP